MNKIISLLLITACSSVIFAEEISQKEKSPLELSLLTTAGYYPKTDHKTGSSHFSGINGIYDGVELVTEFDATYTMPFLNGSDELTADNHLAFKLGLELSPVTVAPLASVTFSPIAFLEFSIGGTIGTGWGLTDDIQGLAKLDESKTKYKNLTPFAHWYLYTWASACFMFDLAAIWEGEWHHIVTTATYKAGYQKMTGTKSTVWGGEIPMVLQTDGSTNRNISWDTKCHSRFQWLALEQLFGEITRAAITANSRAITMATL